MDQLKFNLTCISLSRELDKDLIYHFLEKMDQNYAHLVEGFIEEFSELVEIKDEIVFKIANHYIKNDDPRYKKYVDTLFQDGSSFSIYGIDLIKNLQDAKNYKDRDKYFDIIIEKYLSKISQFWDGGVNEVFDLAIKFDCMKFFKRYFHETYTSVFSDYETETPKFLNQFKKNEKIVIREHALPKILYELEYIIRKDLENKNIYKIMLQRIKELDIENIISSNLIVKYYSLVIINYIQLGNYEKAISQFHSLRLKIALLKDETKLDNYFDYEFKAIGNHLYSIKPESKYWDSPFVFKHWYFGQYTTHEVGYPDDSDFDIIGSEWAEKDWQSKNKYIDINLSEYIDLDDPSFWSESSIVSRVIKNFDKPEKLKRRTLLAIYINLSGRKYDYDEDRGKVIITESQSNNGIGFFLKILFNNDLDKTLKLLVILHSYLLRRSNSPRYHFEGISNYLKYIIKESDDKNAVDKIRSIVHKFNKPKEWMNFFDSEFENPILKLFQKPQIPLPTKRYRENVFDYYLSINDLKRAKEEINKINFDKLKLSTPFRSQKAHLGSYYNVSTYTRIAKRISHFKMTKEILFCMGEAKKYMEEWYPGEKEGGAIVSCHFNILKVYAQNGFIMDAADYLSFNSDQRSWGRGHPRNIEKSLVAYVSSNYDDIQKNINLEKIFGSLLNLHGKVTLKQINSKYKKEFMQMKKELEINKKDRNESWANSFFQRKKLLLALAIKYFNTNYSKNI